MFYKLTFSIIIIISIIIYSNEEETILKSSDIDFTKSISVISSTIKLVIPIPDLGDLGEELVFPSWHKNVGQAIKDWQGNVIKGKGVVFKNFKDDCIQAAKGDGNEVIIVNEIIEEDYYKLNSFINERWGTVNKERLNFKQIKDILEYIQNTLGIGDVYNSTKEFIRSNMLSIDGNTVNNIVEFGLYRRDAREICRAVRLIGHGKFKGPAATMQIYNNGAILVQHGNDVRLVQEDIFLKTYRRFDNKRDILDANREIPLYNSSKHYK